MSPAALHAEGVIALGVLWELVLCGVDADAAAERRIPVAGLVRLPRLAGELVLEEDRGPGLPEAEGGDLHKAARYSRSLVLAWGSPRSHSGGRPGHLQLRTEQRFS